MLIKHQDLPFLLYYFQNKMYNLIKQNRYFNIIKILITPYICKISKNMV